MTRHPQISTLTDFARGLASAARQESVGDHLDGGCRRCAGIVESLGRLVDDAASLEERSPPRWAVRSVVALSSLSDHAARRSPWCTLPLAFDSAVAPATAGVRGGRGSGRDLLFRSAEYALELRIDREGEDRVGRLSGQIIRRPSEPIAEAPVHLVADGRLAATGVTDPFGSFHLEGAEVERFELRLLVDDESALSVSLGDPT